MIRYTVSHLALRGNFPRMFCVLIRVDIFIASHEIFIFVKDTRFITQKKLFLGWSYHSFLGLKASVMTIIQCKKCLHYYILLYIVIYTIMCTIIYYAYTIYYNLSGWLIITILQVLVTVLLTLHGIQVSQRYARYKVPSNDYLLKHIRNTWTIFNLLKPRGNFAYDQV
jgi:hypothetical protein